MLLQNIINYVIRTAILSFLFFCFFLLVIKMFMNSFGWVFA